MSNRLLNTLSQCLCPPGSGVYTVHTGKQRKKAVEQALYGSCGDLAVQQWRADLAAIENNTLPMMLGMCSDVGGGIQRGANWGPLYIRDALLSRDDVPEYYDIGDVRVIPQLLLDEYVAPVLLKQCRKALYGEIETCFPVSPLSIAEHVCTVLYDHLPQARLLTLGGDHSVSYPLVCALLKAQNSKRIALVQWDAHTDIMAHRLGIPICFGSWVYGILEKLPTPAHCVQLGIRSSGYEQAYWEKHYGIKQWWAHSIKKQGIMTVMEHVVAHLNAQNTDGVYITVDVDALDNSYVAATGTPEPDGLTPEDILQGITILSDHFPVLGGDVTEVAPLVCEADSFVRQREPVSTLNYAASICIALLQAFNKR
ncbi:MAG: arginase family protein [Gammaproteobacteria bacterium]